eukprot:CAMPEP_0113505750 /NCGR_PEP_ID=MMETSP0014_2-20120614/35502_1 /TAXON_ID=2857 /ORGANISM="Nitzschia sp." /LENGTH=748 /DNA_ID=CAMNT_0000401121 /DNA_START=236 /DNA_END=2482 /DNA_ORIENTATION=- /assembly_acc=CAM_ASM_000159
MDANNNEPQTTPTATAAAVAEASLSASPPPSPPPSSTAADADSKSKENDESPKSEPEQRQEESSQPSSIGPSGSADMPESLKVLLERSPSNSGSTTGTGLKVLFLSSDTGGGHRASAESLAGQFELLFPGSTYDLLDLATESYLPPYNSIVPYYKHLSAHPTQWKLLYGMSNSRAMERVVETNIKVMTIMCERSIRKRIKSYNPDVVVSVHPLQTSVPILSCAKISHETGKHLPMFTVVTDLGSAHCTWFANGVERMFVGSTQIYRLARERGIPKEKLVLVGLPIRHDFAIQSSNLGDRFSPEGKEYQRQIRAQLKLPAVDRKTLLVMGGGEGVGSLSNIVNALYIELVKQGIDAIIMVVCGRNEELKSSLETRDWTAVFQKRSSGRTARSSRRGLFSTSMGAIPDLAGCGTTDLTDSALTAGCIEAGGTFRSLRKILSSGSIRAQTSAMFIPSPAPSSQSNGISNSVSATNLPPPPIMEDEKKDDKGSTVDSVVSGEEENKKPVEGVSESERATTALSTIQSGGIEYVVADSDNDEEKSSNSDSDSNNNTVRQNGSIDANGTVDVVPLGFVKNMAEYMVACDVLISKAGPGTISEAAAVSLPVMVTSFLPGQEEGNVDYVTEGGFGAFCPDTDPPAIAEEVALWLNDDDKLAEMATAAQKMGHPSAARDIVQQIGDSTLKWRELNEAHSSKGIPTEEEEEALTERTVAEIEAAVEESESKLAAVVEEDSANESTPDSAKPEAVKASS